MKFSRRALFGLTTASTLAHAARPTRIEVPGLHIGVTDWNLRLAGNVEALHLAKRIGFEGVEVSLGRKPINGKLPLDNAGLQAEYRTAVKQTGVQIASVCLDILHVNALKTDPLGQKWLGDAIPVAQELGAPTMLLPVFRDNAPHGPAELDRFADILKEFTPAAERAGVILCLEDSNTAEENVRMFDRVGSDYLKCFYDVSNVLHFNPDTDPVREIQFLGKDRIGCVHLKDGRGYLGASGNLDFRAILSALRDIGYTGWADFETASPSKDIEADMRKNLDFIRSILA